MSIARSIASRAPGIIGWLLVAGVALLLTAVVSSRQPFVGTLIAITAAYALAAVGLDIVVGWLREVSVGQAATMGVGAYAGASLIQHHALLAFACSAVGGAAAGLIVGLPASRVRGFALATYTLVIGLAIQLTLAVLPGYGGNLGETLTPGSLLGIGLSGSSLPVVAVAMLAVALLAYQVLKTSLVGHAWRGIGQNQHMAASLAANPISARMVAFGVAGIAGGVAGMLVSVVTGYLSPTSFSYLLAVQLLAIVIIGGRVHPFGPVVGAAIFGLCQRFISSSTWDNAILGGILVLTVWLAPRGVAVYISLGIEKLGRLIRGRRVQPGTGGTEPAAAGDLIPAPVSQPGSGPADLRLECTGLSKSYSGVTAIREATISFRTGDITAIVGANGAGKTTLLDMLSGHILPDSGSVRIAGTDVTRAAAYKRARRGMLRGFQDAALFPDLTVEETLFLSGFREHRYTVAAAVLRAPKARRNDRAVHGRVRRVAATFNLRKWLRTPIRDLSLGMTKIVQLAAVAVARPRWVLLDEPAAGLARAEVDQLAGVIRRLSADIPDCGIVLVEHDAMLVAETADRVIVMGEGTVLDDLRRGDPGWTDLLSARTGNDKETILAAEPAAKDATLSQPVSLTVSASALPVRGRDRAPVPAVSATGRPAGSGLDSVAGQHSGPSVRAEGVTIRYGAFTAVRDVTIEIPQGKLCVLVGTNGAGKSSILNTIVGLKAPASGRVTIDGRDVTSHAPHSRLHDGLVMVASGRGLLAGLTVAENLRAARTVKTMKWSTGVPDPLELFPELATRMRQRAGTLSGGQQQMLAIARSVQLNPRYLLIDELSLGLSPAVVERLVEALLALRETGVGFLIVEQNAPLALSYSDHAYVMNQGVMAFDGPSHVAAQMPDLFRPVFLETG